MWGKSWILNNAEYLAANPDNIQMIQQQTLVELKTPINDKEAQEQVKELACRLLVSKIAEKYTYFRDCIEYHCIGKFKVTEIMIHCRNYAEVQFDEILEQNEKSLMCSSVSQILCYATISDVQRRWKLPSW